MNRLLATIVVAGLALALLGLVAANMGCAGARQCVFLPVVTMPAQSLVVSPVAATATPVAATATARPAPPTATLNPRPQRIVGLAILGDSAQDEYRADNPRGGAYNATTLNWVEILATVRGINLGPWGRRDEPRREGYAFNWARSGATSEQMLSAGQHLGARQQLLDGQVSHVVIQIGINDFYFGDLALRIYNGSLSGAELEQRLAGIADNIMTAARTLKATGKGRVLVAATQDSLSIPIIPERDLVFPNATGRQQLVDAIDTLNRRLEGLAAQEGLPFFDFNAAFQAEIYKALDPNGDLIVGGERINLRERGDEPHFGLLDDEYVHPGTVVSGLYARVYIEEFNRTFGTAIPPLTDEEILRAAGIKP